VVAVKRENEIEPYERMVRFQLLKEDKQSYLDAATFLNESSIDIVSIQHEYGIYGGDDGEYILDLLANLKKPAIATLHTVLHNPSPNQKRIVQEMGRMCDCLVVMVKIGRKILTEVYGIDPKKVTVIPHGVPNVHRVSAQSVKRALGIADKADSFYFWPHKPRQGNRARDRAMPKILEKASQRNLPGARRDSPGRQKARGRVLS